MQVGGVVCDMRDGVGKHYHHQNASVPLLISIDNSIYILTELSMNVNFICISESFWHFDYLRNAIMAFILLTKYAKMAYNRREVMP